MTSQDRQDPESTSTDRRDTDSRLRDVLVLDYVSRTRHATGAALADAGLNAIPAESLEAGLDALKRQRPDALVVNIDAPGLHGHALYEVISRGYPARSFPIFVASSSLAPDGLEWTATIPDLRVIEAPVTAQKLADGLDGSEHVTAR